MRTPQILTVLILTAGLSGAAAGTALAAERDCADFSSQAEAQAALENDPTDPEYLDANHDGVACEDYDYAAGGQVGTPPTGGVATGDGSTSGSGGGALPFLVGGVGLVAAGGAAVAARRAARGSV